MKIEFSVDALASVAEGLVEYKIGDVKDIPDEIAQLYLEANWAIEIIEDAEEEVK